MKKIVFASHNKGKFKELSALVATLGIELIAQPDLNVTEIAETGKTFIENALLKARNACVQTGMPAIADDSGLIIDALNGEPGIFSSRYAGEEGNAANNIAKVLANLSQSKNRTAAFYCVLVFLRHQADPCPVIGEGRWQGDIVTTPKGVAGFGYDPIFFDATENATAAELTLDKKNRISHRAQALQSLLKQLQNVRAF